jgi:hypothetical protein
MAGREPGFREKNGACDVSAFGGAHFGPMLKVEAVSGPFYLLQSLYLVWVGLLLWELRRVSGSWAISWAGHIGYNVAVLLLLAQR